MVPSLAQAAPLGQRAQAQAYGPVLMVICSDPVSRSWAHAQAQANSPGHDGPTVMQGPVVTGAQNKLNLPSHRHIGIFTLTHQKGRRKL